MARFSRYLAVFVCGAALGAGAWHFRDAWMRPVSRRVQQLSTKPRARFSRPYGMAPAAFDGFKRACLRAKIHPYRLGQTIGDHPRSVGYHHADGFVRYRNRKIPYSAAVDIGTWDLNRAQINRFLESLATQGFAAFYREGPKWRGGEHIHAIYAPLKMKPQLQGQVREWEGKRRKSGRKSFNWQRRWRHRWR